VLRAETAELTQGSMEAASRMVVDKFHKFRIGYVQLNGIIADEQARQTDSASSAVEGAAAIQKAVFDLEQTDLGIGFLKMQLEKARSEVEKEEGLSKANQRLLGQILGLGHFFVIEPDRFKRRREADRSTWSNRHSNSRTPTITRAS